MKQIGIVVALFCVLFVSCSKELNSPLDAEKIAIVESYLYAGDSMITIKITRLLPFSDDTANATEYISGLAPFINDLPMTETASGTYSVHLGSNLIQPGDRYELKFLYHSDTVSSSASIPYRPVNFSISDNKVSVTRQTGSGGGMPPGEMEDIDLTWDNEDGGYYYVLVEYLESTPDYINSYSSSLDLPLVEAISPMSSAGTRIGMRQLYFFGSYRIVLFHVTKDFVDLYQNIQTNSNNITDPVTSITNGYGVFTGMASDTVFLEVVEN